MKHARQSIREAAAAALSGISDATIVTNRLKGKASLPAIVVRTGQESTRESDRDLDAEYDRFLTLVFRIYLQGTDDVEDELDDYAAQIEAAIALDSTLGGWVLETFYQTTTVDFEEEGEGYPLAYLDLEYRVWYRTTAADPETSI